MHDTLEYRGYLIRVEGTTHKASFNLSDTGEITSFHQDIDTQFEPEFYSVAKVYNDGSIDIVDWIEWPEATEGIESVKKYIDRYIENGAQGFLP